MQNKGIPKNQIECGLITIRLIHFGHFITVMDKSVFFKVCDSEKCLLILKINYEKTKEMYMICTLADYMNK